MNKAQKLQLNRIKLGSFNEFDGDVVAEGLVKHRQLWDAFVFGRFRHNLLVELRDLQQDYINADTIMVLTDEERAEKLMIIAKKEWNANEVGFSGSVNGEFIKKGNDPCHTKTELYHDLGGGIDNFVVVRLWWD